MSFESICLNLNAIICSLICFRLLFYQKSGRYRFNFSLMAYLLILTSAWAAFRICWEQYQQIDPAELLFNFIVCVGIWRARGNLAKIACDKAS